MRILIIFILFILTDNVSFGQNRTCKSLQAGKFKVVTKESGTTFIERSNDLQIEENDALGYKIEFDITWVDECTYELRPKRLIKGDPVIMGNGKNVLTTRIRNITNTHYVAETSANFSDVVMDFEVEIVK